MDPRDSQHTTMSRQPSPDGEPESARRMDPRWWLLPPFVALCILGAYFMGQRMAPETTGVPEQVAPQPVLQNPPAPPKGRITVTEVPRPAPAPVRPRPAPAPAPAITPPPTPPQTEPYHQIEPPVVLTPPEEAPSDEQAPAIMPPEPPSGGAPVETPSVEPDREPVKLNEPALEYPSSAYESGVEGTAQVSFTVTADGRVRDPRVTGSSGDSRLDQAAVDYARRLRFRPGIRNGKPADVRVSRSVQFRLR